MAEAPDAPHALPVTTNRDVLLGMLPLAGKTVVDVGCGDGRLARVMADAGDAAQVIGLECSARQLTKAAALPAHARVGVREGVAEAMPLPDASADVVVFFNSLHHVPVDRMAAGLAEAARVLRPGGLCYVGEPVAEGPFFEVCRPVDDETDVRAAAQAALRAAPDLRILREHRYIHVVRMPDFEAFRDRLTSANTDRDAYFAAHDAEMRALFESRAKRDADGAYLFDQPGHAVLLEKVAG